MDFSGIHWAQWVLMGDHRETVPAPLHKLAERIAQAIYEDRLQERANRDEDAQGD